MNDPTVDTVTSLQNWEFLDRLPELARLFERELDREKVKINIGTFFDTLFSLLDDNHDGQIDSKELRPVLDVMSLASMNMSDPAGNTHHIMVKFMNSDSGEQIKDYLRAERGKHFDPAIVDWVLNNVARMAEVRRAFP